MDQSDKILEIALDTQSKVDSLASTVGHLSTAVGDLSSVVSANQKQFDQLLTVVLDIQHQVNDFGEWRKKVDVIIEGTYNKLDGFLVLINRHESEIAALRSAYERLEERLEVLEKQAA